MMFYIGEDDNEVEEAYKVCQERRPLGILFLGSNREYLRQSFHLIKVPCVLVTNSAEGLEFENLSSVSTDDKAAAKTAVDYLFSMGHEHIGILGGNTANSPTALRRYMGVQASFEEHGIVFDDARQYITSYFSISDGYHAMERLLERMPELTAVFAMSDVTAIGAIRAIHDRGMRVPEDISVIGFDGIDVGRYMVPRLVTIRQYREVIAVRSVEILLSCIEGSSKSIYEVESFHLVPGESVRAR